MRCAAAPVRPRSSRSSWRSCSPTPRLGFRASIRLRGSSPSRARCRCRRSGSSARATTARRSRPLLGVGFAFARHLNPRGAADAIARYRDAFQPTGRIAAPRVILATSAICADTTQRAQDLAASMALGVIRLRCGPAGAAADPRGGARLPLRRRRARPGPPLSACPGRRHRRRGPRRARRARAPDRGRRADAHGDGAQPPGARTLVPTRRRRARTRRLARPRRPIAAADMRARRRACAAPLPTGDTPTLREAPDQPSRPPRRACRIDA